jgi:hypothetical protein
LATELKIWRLRAKCLKIKKGMIQRVELKRSFAPRAMGQVTAGKKGSELVPGTSQRTFAKRIQQLPSMFFWKKIGTKYGMVPVRLHYEMLKIKFKYMRHDQNPFD